MYHKSFWLWHKIYFLHNCSINDIPVWGNVLKDLHLCKRSSKVEGQDGFLLCSLQYLQNGFVLWTLGQIYARLQELNYHQWHKYTPVSVVWWKPIRCEKAKIEDISVKRPCFSRPQWISFFLGIKRIEVRKRHNPVKILCAPHISWWKIYESLVEKLIHHPYFVSV